MNNFLCVELASRSYWFNKIIQTGSEQQMLIIPSITIAWLSPSHNKWIVYYALPPIVLKVSVSITNCILGNCFLVSYNSSTECKRAKHTSRVYMNL